MAIIENNHESGSDHLEPGQPGPGANSNAEARFDPYFLYARDTNFRFIDLQDKDELPILVELTVPVSRIFEEGAEFLPANSRDWFRISRLFEIAPEVLKESRFAAAAVRRQFFQELRMGKLDKAIVRFELCAPVPGAPSAWPKDGKTPPDDFLEQFNQMRTPTQEAQSGPSSQQAAPAPPAPSSVASAAVPSKVVVGLIDDGIAFANRRFRDKAGTQTRLLSFWGQDLVGPVGLPGPWPSYGRIISRPRINSLFASSTHGGFLDEDAVYRKAGLDYSGAGHKSWGRRAGHGTHVLDLAAGLNGDEVQPTSPLIAAVQLPVAVTVDTSGAKLTSYALDGFIWILLNAYWAGLTVGTGPLPCVVNLSYGTLDGPHDGTSIFARAVDDIIGLLRTAGWKVSVVLPAGNGHVSQTHARVALPPGALASRTIDWRLLPDTRTPGFAEIWLPDITVSKQVDVRVTSPTGVVSGWIGEMDPIHHWPNPGQPVLWVHHPGVDLAVGSRKRILIAVFPTATLDPAEPVAPTGVWRIELLNQGSFPLIVDAFIGRNDTPLGYPILGRQSRFEDSDYLEHRYRPDGRIEQDDVGGSQVMRAASLNGLATGKLPVVVGGCRVSDLSVAPYSAGGPTIVPGSGPPPPRPGPDALMPSDHSYVRAGILAAGTRSGSTVTMRGTSVAAPQMTRAIARAMALGGNGTRTQVEAAVTSQESTVHKPSVKPAGPLEPAPAAIRGGSGRFVLPANQLPVANSRR